MRVIVACRAIDNMAGGVERQSIGLINALVARGHAVCLMTMDPDGSQAFYPIDDAVEWHQMGMGDPRYKASFLLRLKRMKRARGVVRNFKPDVILAFQHGTFFTLKLYTLGQGVPMIASTRNAPSILKFTSIGKRKNFIFQTLRMADLITVQFENYRAGYPPYLRHKIKFVPNAIARADKISTPRGDGDSVKTLLAVGRLSFQKNFHLLIQAFAQISSEFPKWRLFIAGDGEERTKLEALIEKHKMNDTVEMPGAIEDVNSLYCSSHVFCLPSLWEGFPNALSEALMHGLPSVGFVACDGVNNLIHDQENGLLATNYDSEKENVESLAQSLKLLMMDADLREQMGVCAARSMKPYYPEGVFDQWEQILEEFVDA